MLCILRETGMCTGHKDKKSMILLDGEVCVTVSWFKPNTDVSTRFHGLPRFLSKKTSHQGLVHNNNLQSKKCHKNISLFQFYLQDLLKCRLQQIFQCNYQRHLISNINSPKLKSLIFLIRK